MSTKVESDEQWVGSPSRILSWGESESGGNNGSGAAVKSSGISPKRFHKRERNVSSNAEHKIRDLLDTATKKEIIQKRREHTSDQKLRRSAYRDVTSLKTFPIQDLAMKDLDSLMRDYLGIRSPSSPTQSQTPPNKSSGLVESPVGGENVSDASASSTSSIEETKRRKDDFKSPAKSTMKNKYAAEFLRDKSIPPPIEGREETGNVDDSAESHVDKENSTEEDQLPQESHAFLSPLWSMEPRIFSSEKSATGKRRYIVGNLGRFIDLYWRKTDPKVRHYYELIRESTPCRLFFDLEYCKLANSHISSDDNEELMTDFIEELCCEFETIYSIKMDRSCIVDLDSSTGKKFSRHLIIHLPKGELFPDAVSAGYFVKGFVGRLAGDLATGTLKRAALAKFLFVNVQAPKKKSGSTDEPETKLSSESNPESANNSANASCSSKQPIDQKQTCFVDLGVYTRNRLFRMMGSTKFGKPSSAALRIAAANKFQFPPGFSNAKFYLPEQAHEIAGENPADITNAALKDIQDTSKSSLVNRDHEKFRSAMDWESHAEALAATLVVPANASKTAYPILSDANDHYKLPTTKKAIDGIKGARQPFTSSASLMMNRPKSRVATSNGETPLPLLEDFILNKLATRGGTQGSIRTWSIDSSSSEGGMQNQIMSFYMKDNRWCENIERAHKGNNIMWNVCFHDMTCWQTCHDPECRLLRFRGRTIHLPNEVQSEISEYTLDQELAALDEDKIIAQAKIKKTAHENEFDDPELEEALLALDISGFKSTKASGDLIEAANVPKQNKDICEPNSEPNASTVSGSSPPAEGDTAVNDSWDNDEFDLELLQHVSDLGY